MQVSLQHISIICTHHLLKSRQSAISIAAHTNVWCRQISCLDGLEPAFSLRPALWMADKTRRSAERQNARCVECQTGLNLTLT